MITIGPPVPYDSGWRSHQPLLRASIEATTGPVLEFGAGDGSTRFLNELIVPLRRALVTCENNAEWLAKYEDLRGPFHDLRLVGDWAEAPVESVVNVNGQRWGVAFIDHAPGERRCDDIRRCAQTADIVVIHDTQPGQARAGYGYDSIWGLFKHIRHDDRLGEGAWTTACSNFVNVNEWRI